MTKKGKIITGVVAGVTILGGIGALTDTDKPDSILESSTTTSAIIEEITEKTDTEATIEEITTTTEKTTTATIAETTSATTTTDPETEATTPPPETSTTTEATNTTEADATQSTTAPILTTERENHFTDYNNPEQQNTTEYVLNTNTLKVHRPSCSDVKKIKPENYSTTKDLQNAISNGYTACGRCDPF